MSDTPNVSQTDSQGGTKEVEVKIITPPKWTRRHYDAWTKARIAYVNSQKGPSPQLFADYAGVCKLIEAGFVHVYGIEVPALDDEDGDLATISLLVDIINEEVSKATARPSSLKISLNPGTSQNNTSDQ